MQGKLEYSVVKFAESLEASFIGSGKEPDERYSPRILGNDDQGSANVLSTLKAELADCASFSFSVAFITASGMQVLAGILADLRDRGVPGRILTSTYLNFNISTTSSSTRRTERAQRGIARCSTTSSRGSSSA